MYERGALLRYALRVMWGFPKREERGSVARASAALRVSRARALTGADVRKRNSAYAEHADSRRQTCSQKHFNLVSTNDEIERAVGPTDWELTRRAAFARRWRRNTSR